MMQNLSFCAIVKEIVILKILSSYWQPATDSRKGSISHVQRENRKIILV